MARTSLLPQFITTAFGALDQLAQATGHLASATNHLAATVDDACEGFHEISNIMISQQKQQLLANLQEA